MSTESSHYYCPITKEPKHFVPKKDGTGNRPTTIKDAKANGWYPSVTTIISKVLAKPALIEWIVQQNVLAAVTTPRLDGESLDDFVKRIMEKDAKAETDAARDRGTEMHAALELLFQGRGAEVSPEILPWVEPAYKAIAERSATKPIIESVVVGEGYAGKVDLRQIERDCFLWLWDWKTTKKLPKCAYDEAILQCAAYAQAVALTDSWQPHEIRTGNVYISTKKRGAFVICEHGDWQETFERGFLPLLTHWQWACGYVPQQTVNNCNTAKLDASK